jgi:ferredoxin-NADP reductase
MLARRPARRPGRTVLAAPDLREARVEQAVRVGPALVEVTFSTTDGPLAYTAGQWLSFRVAPGGESDKGVWRVYSFSSSPLEEEPGAAGQFRVLVDIAEPGPGSDCFSSLAPGDRILYHGPYGSFTLRPTMPTRAIFAADGVGIGPVRSLLRTLCDGGGVPCPVTLVQEAETVEALLFRDEFESLAATTRAFTYVPTVPSSDRLWRGERRELRALLPVLHPEPEGDAGTHWYLCGSGRHTDRLRDWLRNRGVPREALIVERFFD